MENAERREAFSHASTFSVHRSPLAASRRWLLPSLKDALFVALVAAPFLRNPSGVLSDGDIGWHIRNGEEILRTLTVPRTDPFSFTRYAQPWISFEWLSDAVFGWAHAHAGLTGVAVLAHLLFALTFVLLFRRLLADAGHVVLALALTLLAAAASSIHLLARPHLFTLLAAVVWSMVLDRVTREGRPRFLWWCLPLMLVWVNVHGGFYVGLALAAIYAAGHLLTAMTTRDPDLAAAARRLARAYALALGGCLAVTLVNPYGFHLHEYLLGYLQSRSLMDGIAEFMSPDFHRFPLQAFEALLLASLAALAVAPRTISWTEGLLLLTWTHLALFSVRHVPLYTVVVSPIIARQLAQPLERLAASAGRGRAFSRWLPALARHSRALAAFERRLDGVGYLVLAAIVAVTLSVASEHGWRTGWPRGAFGRGDFPVSAADAMDSAGVPARLFTTDSWAGYLVYRFHPRYRAFFDGRHAFYGPALVRDYDRVLRLQPGWDRILAAHQITAILLPVGYTSAEALSVVPGWRAVHRDDQAVLFVRGTQ